MILRKPYAFLIKNFRKINLVLLLLTIFILWRDFSLYGFVKNYISTGIYNTVLDSISNYIGIFEYLALILSMIISTILLVLLKYKQKPYLIYLINLIVNGLTLILMIYVKYYFTYTITTEFILSNALVIRDLSFISTLPYYILIFILSIRAIGLDLKSFGFGEDKEFIETDEEDREEVEVEVKFDKDKYKRNLKKQIRMTKYFVIEHKFSITLISIFVFLIAAFNIYNYTFVENKIYKQNESFTIDGYKISVNNTYITNRDYTGNIITKNMSYLVLDTTISNLSNNSREFDPSNLFLYVDDSYSIASDRFNTSFIDMGNLYEKDKSIKGRETKKITFIFEIKEPKENSNFLLTYQKMDLKKKPTRIRINVVDISNFITKNEKKLTEKIEVPLNLQTSFKFSFDKYEVSDSIKYKYGECNTSGTCPIYEKTLNNNNGKVLFLKFDINDKTKADFITFVSKYGKIRYTVDNVVKEIKIKNMLNSYRGNYLYLDVNNDLVNASNIKLVFTVRSYQYLYNIKGE